MEPDKLAAQLQAGRCPSCGSSLWWRGPQGGLSVNIACASCGDGYNVVVLDEHVVMAQAIGRRTFIIYGDKPEPLLTAGRARGWP